MQDNHISHMFRNFQSTNDTKPKRWRLVPEFFGRLKMRKKRKLIENGTPKSTSTVKK